MARQTREGRRISDELLDELLAGDDPAEVFRSGSLIDDLKKAVAERALDAEMDAHLEHEPASGARGRLCDDDARERERAPCPSPCGVLTPSKHAAPPLPWSFGN